MARQWEVHYQGASALFTLNKITRANLYGARKRFPIDAQRRVCSRAALTRDGRYVLPAGSTASLYLDEVGEVVERESLLCNEDEDLAVDEGHDAPVEVEPSTILDHTITHVYTLDPVTIPPGLDAVLSSGKVYRTAHRFRAGSVSYDAFFLKNTEGYFLLLGEPNGFDFIGLPEADISPPELDEEGTDSLDFSMQ